MKQHITLKQLYELSLKARLKLRKWCIERNYCGLENEVSVLRDMQLSIGQMIEFLGENYIGALYNHSGNAILLKVKPENICDVLWQAVKDKLSEVGRVEE